MFQYLKHVDFYTNFSIDISLPSKAPTTTPRPTPINRDLAYPILLLVWLLPASPGCFGCPSPCRSVDRFGSNRQQHAKQHIIFYSISSTNSAAALCSVLSPSSVFQSVFKLPYYLMLYSLSSPLSDIHLTFYILQGPLLSFLSLFKLKLLNTYIPPPSRRFLLADP